MGDVEPSGDETPVTRQSTVATPLVPATPISSTNLGNGTDFSTGVSPAFTPVEKLMPFPKAGPRKSRGARQRLKSEILTDTPVRKKMRLVQESRATKKSSGAKKLQLADDEKVACKKRSEKPKQKAATCSKDHGSKKSKRQKTKVAPDHQKPENLVELPDECHYTADKCGESAHTMEENSTNTNCRPTKAKRIQKRLFNITEALQAIQADSDNSEFD